MAQRKTFKREDEFYCIEARYELGGINCFSGNNDRRGIYIHFSIKEVKDGWERQTMFDGASFKILFQELKRKSSKKLSEADAWIEANKDDLFGIHEKWMLRLIDEKGFELTDTVDGEISIRGLMNLISRADEPTQNQIKRMLVNIDIVNGDIMHFLNFLAQQTRQGN